VVTAGKRLWYTTAAGGGLLKPWEQIVDLDIGSAPDCVLTADYTVNIVALTTSGTVVYAHGTSGNFASVDLGAH
jgi:hypothetical protein